MGAIPKTGVFFLFPHKKQGPGGMDERPTALKTETFNVLG